MRSVAFQTLGCRLNQAETAALAGEFEMLGFMLTQDPEAADVVVIHSCAVTHAAEQNALRLVRQSKRRAQGQLVVFTGCVSAIADHDLLREAGADLIVAQSDKASLPARVAAALGEPATSPSPYLPRFGTTRALVKVQDGCDFRCAYCIIPDTRGDPTSRPLEEIVTEVAELSAGGFREVVLTGVNVACYNDRGRTLVDLLRALCELPQAGRLRLSSIEPATTERELFDFAAAESRLCRTLHYPLQSGDVRVLRSMRRRYTPEQFTDSVRYALERLPDLGLGTDVITGFPGEDDAAFEATRTLLESLPFSNIHVFPYSERPGTPAAEMAESVPVHLRRERARELLRLAERKRRDFAARFVGREVEVLVERRDANGIGRGWTGEYVETRIANCPPEAVGQVLKVTPDSATEGKLLTTVAPEASAAP